MLSWKASKIEVLVSTVACERSVDVMDRRVSRHGVQMRGRKDKHVPFLTKRRDNNRKLLQAPRATYSRIELKRCTLYTTSDERTEQGCGICQYSEASTRL